MLCDFDNASVCANQTQSPSSLLMCTPTVHMLCQCSIGMSTTPMNAFSYAAVIIQA